MIGLESVFFSIYRCLLVWDAQSIVILDNVNESTWINYIDYNPSFLVLCIIQKTMPHQSDNETNDDSSNGNPNTNEFIDTVGLKVNCAWLNVSDMHSKVYCVLCVRR